MAKRLILISLLLALAGSVVSGMPLHSSNSHMMKCCDKAKSADQTPEAYAARLCCAVDCSDSTPTPSSSSYNTSPSNFTLSRSISDQIVSLLKTSKVQPVLSFSYELYPILIPTRPKHIQHNSFLI